MVSIYAPYQCHWSRERGAQGDFRASSPRFQGQNFDRNLALVDAVKTIAYADGNLFATATLNSRKLAVSSPDQRSLIPAESFESKHMPQWSPYRRLPGLFPRVG